MRQQVSQELRRQAQQYVRRALDRVVEIMESDATPPEVALKAAGMIFDRAAGKPVQETVTDDSTGEQIREAMAVAAENTRRVMALPPPRERPMGEVTELRPRRRYLPSEAA